MWPKMCVGIAVLSVASLIGGRSVAAPLPNLGSANISGTVVEVKWSAKETRKGLPGMSGSAGHDRVVAAHFLVRLKDYEGVDAAKARAFNAFVGQAEDQPNQQQRKPTVLVLRIDSEDKKLFKPGMKIKVTGYTVRGDEGGTWTKYEKLEILSTPKEEKKK